MQPSPQLPCYTLQSLQDLTAAGLIHCVSRAGAAARSSAASGEISGGARRARALAALAALAAPYVFTRITSAGFFRPKRIVHNVEFTCGAADRPLTAEVASTCGTDGG